jgi:formate-dependent nitrite reductase membrane component NrfD
MSATAEQSPSYYDVPILKPPVWKWEIAGYFFFGGLAAGSYVVSRLAGRFGGPAARPVRRAGTAIAAAAMVPCAPLLIKDLGHMARFHHMLRVFKPGTPMNLGTWTMTTFTGAVAIAAGRELAERDAVPLPAPMARALRSEWLQAPAEAAGVPLGLMMMTYSGVLLSCTANPSWARNPWIAPLFVSGAFSAGLAAIDVALAVRGNGGAAGGTDVSRILRRIETASHAAEAVCLAGYIASLGERARPLLSGSQAPQVMLAASGIALPHLIQKLPIGARVATIAAGCLALAGAFALRWAVVYAGQESARDPALARSATARGTKDRRDMEEDRPVSSG